MTFPLSFVTGTKIKPLEKDGLLCYFGCLRETNYKLFRLERNFFAPIRLGHGPDKLAKLSDATSKIRTKLP